MLSAGAGGQWSDRQNWANIQAALQARRRHAGEPGHAGVCVLEDPRTTNPAQMMQCSRALPAVDTVLGRAMRAEIDELVEDNGSNPIARRAVILEGEATFGKTTATMFEVLRRSRRLVEELGTSLDGVHSHIPWAYIEVGAGWGYRDIAEAIQRHLGLPIDARATAAAKIAYLRQMLPLLGTEGVVIDDAHNLRATPDSSRIDGLKNLLTGMPTSLLFIGLSPMSRSALLTGAAQGKGTSVQQIARRSRIIRADLGQGPAQLRKDWDRLVDALLLQLHLPGESVALLTNQTLRDELHRATAGLFGPTYELLREGAKGAILSTRPFEEALVEPLRRYAAPTPVVVRTPARTGRRTVR